VGKCGRLGTNTASKKEKSKDSPGFFGAILKEGLSGKLRSYFGLVIKENASPQPKNRQKKEPA